MGGIIMNVLLVGADGQLGLELIKTASGKINFCTYTFEQLDITDPVAVQEVVEKTKPDWVINAAAYTAVDKAEEERDKAFAVNQIGAGNVAKAAKQANVQLVHISTDFVFDGNKSIPYLIDDKPNPLNVYGESKLAGDNEVLAILPDTSAIIRTAWVYSSYGNNFVKTMLGLMSERDELSVVADQIGSPTWANGLAMAIWQIIEKKIHGLFHWTDAGVASWYDFAVAIQEEALATGILDNSHSCTVKPIRTEDYPTAAIRPQNCVLDKTTTWQALGVAPTHWRVALRQMMSELKQHDC